MNIIYLITANYLYFILFTFIALKLSLIFSPKEYRDEFFSYVVSLRIAKKIGIEKTINISFGLGAILWPVTVVYFFIQLIKW